MESKRTLEVLERSIGGFGHGGCPHTKPHTYNSSICPHLFSSVLAEFQPKSHKKCLKNLISMCIKAPGGPFKNS